MATCPTCNDKRSVWEHTKGYVPCPNCNSDGTVDPRTGESIEPSKTNAHPGDEESLEIEGYEPMPGE